ncbi:barstar family protein [Bacillus cereus]|uniref:Ribonuclease inhibitor n=1 Tax=Bacillus cereus TaxID=1396 RepID=A0A1S9UEW8_BACCE|nr:barstar family protein [Bacillus cereus]OOR20759.1 ribonuclease inhibitor [Bacillus cereus]PGY17767.1 ribonuclease inhibitor [Bacillus cereus]
MKIEKKIKVLSGPYIHLMFMDEFQRLMQLESKDNFGYVSIDGKNCVDIVDLFNEFSNNLRFPDYFSDNWNSFDECINDLGWFEAEQYVIFINDANSVLLEDNENFESFIRILYKTCVEWAKGRDYGALVTIPTPFHVVFHCTADKENYIIERIRHIGIDKLDIIK